MTDAEYQRIMRARRKAVADGKAVGHVAVSADRAAYMRQWRAQRTKPVKPPKQEERMSDDALNAVILTRGKVLTEMMRTPLALWPAEWFD